ncbi:hypothetical protein C0J52_08398, partial [Blattella germanica]
ILEIAAILCQNFVDSLPLRRIYTICPNLKFIVHMKKELIASCLYSAQDYIRNIFC